MQTLFLFLFLFWIICNVKGEEKVRGSNSNKVSIILNWKKFYYVFKLGPVLGVRVGV